MFWRADLDPATTPYDVALQRGVFTDPARGGREIPYKLYTPKSAEGGPALAGPYPLIVWSHGFGGNRDGAGFLSRYVAGHGYALLHITHAGTDSSLWEGRKGHPWDILRRVSISRETTLQRFHDVTFALDAARREFTADPALAALIDFDRLGISGHSLGSMTAQVVAGQTFPNEEHNLTSYRDPRFAAAIFYSPVPIQHLTGETPEPYIYGPIAIPSMHMTGTNDHSPIEGFNYKRRTVVHEYAGHADKYLLIKNDGDHMVYNGTRGKLEINPLREPHENVIKIFSLAFWDAYLKGDARALEWLRGEESAAWLAPYGEFMQA